MGIKYQQALTDRQGRAVEVRLRKAGYGGSVSGVRLGAEPVRREVEGSDSDPLKPLRPSMARLKLHPSEASVAAEMRSSNVDWYLQVLVEGTEDFRGVYRPGLLDRSDDKFAVEPTELLFNDGLGQLQETSLIQDGDSYRGRRSIIYWVCRCLNLLPSFLQMEVAVASSWYTPAMSSPQPLAQEVVSQSRWVEDGDSLSAWEVLENLVGEKLAFLTQAGTQWRLHQRSFYKDGSSFEHEVYDLDGFTPATLSPNLLRTETHDPSLSLSDSYIERLKGARIGERGSRAAVEVTYEHQTVDNALPNLRTELDQWEQDFNHIPPNVGSVGVVNLPDVVFEEDKTVREMLSSHDGSTLSPPYETHKNPIRIDADGSALAHELNAEVRVPTTVEVEERFTGLSYTEIILHADDGTTYWLKRDVKADGDGYEYEDATWETTESLVAYQVDIGKQVGGDPQQTNVIRSEETVEAPPLPDDAELEFRFWGLIMTQPDLINDVGGGEDEDLIKYNVYRSPLRPTTTSGERRKTTSETSSIDPDEDTYKRTVFHGTGPTSSHPAATFVGGSAAQDWAVGTGHSQGVPADELLARETLQQLAARLGVRSWEVHDAVPQPTDVLETGGGVSLPGHMVRHYKKGTTDVKFVEVIDAGVGLSVTVEVGSDDSSGGGGSSGGSGDGSGSAPAWEQVKRKPSGILSRSGEGGTTVPTKSDIAGALGHDSLGDGIQTSIREEGAASDEALPTEQAVREEVATVGEGATLIAQELVQTQAEIDSLDAVTVRKAREIKGGNGIDPVGDLSEDRTVAISEEGVGKEEIAAAALGKGLKGGAGTALSVEPEDFAGDGLEDEDSDNLGVNSTVARTDRDETFEKDVTVQENLYVNGTEFITDTETVQANDNLLFLNFGEQGNGVTAGEVGLEADRGTAPPVKLYFDEVADTGRIGVNYRTITYSGLSGSFNTHEEVVGQSSGASGLVWDDNGAKLRLKGRTGGFQDGETITGQSSGATATVDSTSQVDLTNRLAPIVDAPTETSLAFWDAPQAGEPRLDTSEDLQWDPPWLRTLAAEHPEFATGWTGNNWRVDEEGNMAGESLFLRGSLTVNELIVNRIHAVDGTQIIGPGRGKVASVAGAAPGETVTLEDPNESGVSSFREGDICIVQTVDIDSTQLVKRLVRKVDSVDNNPSSGDAPTVTFTSLSGGPSDTGTFEEGDTIVVIGNVSEPARQSVLVATATGTNTGEDAPYRRAISGVDSWPAWQSADKVQTQTGNLDGLAWASGFGAFFRDNLFVGMNEEGTGDSMRLGKNVDGSGAFGIQIGGNNHWKYDSEDELWKFRVGNDSSFIDWSGTSLDIVLSSGPVDDSIEQLQADVRLLAEHVTQESQSRAGLEINVNENSALIELNAQVIGDQGQFSKSTLSLQASTNEGAITTLSARVGDGDGFSESDLTLQASTNESAISTLSSVVGDDSEFSESTLSLQAGQNEADLKLLARRVTQETQARAGVEANVNENAATLTASVQFSETTSSETNRAALELFAGPGGSSATIVGKSIQLDGDTIVSGDFTVQEANIGPDFTAQGAESQTIRKNAPPPEENATDGRPVQKGDVWIDTADGDKPYTYDGTSPYDLAGWTPAYTVISGGDITTGTIQGPSSEYEINLDDGTFTLNEGEVGNWDIRPNTIQKDVSLTTGHIFISTDADSFDDGGWKGDATVDFPTIAFRKGSDPDDRTFVNIGETYSNGWTGRHGFSVTLGKAEKAIFEASVDSNGDLFSRLEGDVLVDGSVTATKIDVMNLSAVNTNTGALTVSDTLMMGSGGLIRNNPGGTTDYQIDEDGFTLRPDSGFGIQSRRVNWEDGDGNELGHVSVDGPWDGSLDQSDATMQVKGGLNVLMFLDDRDGQFMIREAVGSNVKFNFEGFKTRFQDSSTSTDKIVLKHRGSAGDPYIDMALANLDTDPPTPPSDHLRMYVNTDSDGNTALWVKSEDGDTSQVTGDF